jgi:subtilisin family serine protease
MSMQPYERGTKLSVNTRLISKRILNLSLVVVVSTALLFAMLYGDGSAQAQTADTPTPEATAESGDEFGDQQLPPIEGKLNPPKYPNMDSNLNRIAQQAQSGQFTAQAAASAPVHIGASVAVTFYITEGYAQGVWDWLEENGASPRNIGADYIEAYVPVSLLPTASELEGVISVRAIIPPQPAQGVVVSEGVAAHGVPAWHAADLKGQGVKIGVIDGSFEGFEDLMGTELPTIVQAKCYIELGISTDIIKDCTNNIYNELGRKHGTAVTEAIFDIAPEATYFIANIQSYGDLLDAVEWMASQDVDVVNMSVGFTFDGPGDGTSPYSHSPLRVVDIAVAGGITWVNAAGNGARTNWFGSFTDLDADQWHNFTTEDECSSVTIYLRPLERFIAQLRWSDTWEGASSDLDLHLIMPTENEWFSQTDAVASSENEQLGRTSDAPYERISLNYGDVANGEYCLAVRSQDGSAPSWINLHVWGVRELEHYTSARSISNPGESFNPGLLAVGAAPWINTSTIEPFSSRGPTNDGRFKPDIVGVDGGQSVSYRSQDNRDGYFFGTSQASPHVAGIAALVKQNHPSYGPQQIANYLKINAEPRGAVPNNTWGYGFAMLPAITPEPTPVTPEIPQDVLDRISMLETLVATLQSLISTLEGKLTALDGRVTTLETDTPVPTPTPTVAPSTDACVTPITSDGAIVASWMSACESTNRLLDPDRRDDGAYYARYYTFDLGAPSFVTITMESSEDTFLYLLNGKGKTGRVAHVNDDIEPRVNTNSQIEQTLEAGSYTIEAATYNSGVVGSSFTLTVSGIE